MLATLRTLGVLLGLWAILAIVGLALGAIPFGGSDASRDAGARRADAGAAAAITDAGVEAEPDAGAAAESEIATAPASPALARHVVCAAGEPSLAAGDVFGDARPELLIGCADGWQVAALDARGPARGASFRLPAAADDLRPFAGPAAFGDVDGDAHVDLVLPLLRATAEGTSRGGALWWIATDNFGGIREPIALAPIAAAGAAVAPFDGEPGAEVVALNRANPLAQLPSEAWVFRGGAAPARATSLQTGLAGAQLRVADLDRDGRGDVAAVARDRVDLFFGDEELSFTRRHSMRMPSAIEIATGDIDGDGGDDLVVLGAGLRWIRGGEVSGMEPHAIEGAPEALREIAILDVDGDGRADVVGWEHPRLVALAQREPGRFTRVELAALPGFGVRRHAILDADGDGARDDLALIGGAQDGPLELVIVPDALAAADRAVAEAAVDLADAPLMLRATLP